jgi:hypothetical protein
MDYLLQTHADTIMLLVGFVAFAAVAGIVISRYFKYKHAERIALIEKGLDLPVSESNLQKRMTIKGVLKLGILFCGAGLGVLTGFILERTIDAFVPPLPYLFAIPFLTGISLIIFYLVSKE